MARPKIGLNHDASALHCCRINNILTLSKIIPNKLNTTHLALLMWVLWLPMKALLLPIITLSTSPRGRWLG